MEGSEIILSLDYAVDDELKDDGGVEVCIDFVYKADVTFLFEPPGN